MTNTLNSIRELISQSDKIAILSGAGVSTPSGIRDFRGSNGLYTEEFFGLNPEQILSKRFFNTYRDMFYQYYIKYITIPDTLEPNSIHTFTKELADKNKLVGVVTQNIDGLYQKAGLSDEYLVEMHGNGTRWLCTKCKQEVVFEESRFNERSGNYLSKCHEFIIRPDIILYDETFKLSDIKRMQRIYTDSDLLIVMGTRLDITAHLDSVQNFKGKIVLLNNDFVDLGFRQWDATYLGSIEDVCQ